MCSSLFLLHTPCGRIHRSTTHVYKLYPAGGISSVLDRRIQNAGCDNKRIAEEVKSLKTNLGSIEEKARKDLGMIKQGETFYLVIDEDNGLLKND